MATYLPLRQSGASMRLPQVRDSDKHTRMGSTGTRPTFRIGHTRAAYRCSTHIATSRAPSYLPSFRTVFAASELGRVTVGRATFKLSPTIPSRRSVLLSMILPYSKRHASPIRHHVARQPAALPLSVTCDGELCHTRVGPRGASHARLSTLSTHARPPNTRLTLYFLKRALYLRHRRLLSASVLVSC
jgi:hypothetical protein